MSGIKYILITIRTNEELRRLVGVEPITTFIRSGRLKWYGHLKRKGNEDWVKKCMEYRVEGRRPIGRPRKTWLESVKADMAELEIDKEDVHVVVVLLSVHVHFNMGLSHRDS